MKHSLLTRRTHPASGGNIGSSYHPAGPCLILNRNGYPQFLRQAVTHNPCPNVRGAARVERNNHFNWFTGILAFLALETSLQITQEARITTIAHNTELLSLLDFMSLPPLVNDVSELTSLFRLFRSR